MSKIDLAIHGYPSRTPFATAARRSAKVWLCLTLIGADALALLVGFAIGVRVEQPGMISSDVWTTLLGVMLVHAGIAFQNQAYATKCLTSGLSSCRQALLSIAGTLLVFLLTGIPVAFGLAATGLLFGFIGMEVGLFSTSLFQALPLRVAALRRALRNLVDNARLYGAPPVVVATRIDGVEAVLSVADAGVGIAPEAWEQLRRPFARGSHARNPGGCGLGLAIVQRVAHMHGGRLCLQPASAGRPFAIELCLPLRADDQRQ